MAGGREHSLALEREAVQELARSRETARLINLFFQKEDADKKPALRGHPMPVHEAVVIGAGVMGASIAHWLASHGVRVLMTDVNAGALAAGSLRVRSLLEDGVRKQVLSPLEARNAMDRLSLTAERVPLARCPLVIEAATETLELKKKIFADLSSRTAADAVLATNTSALSIAELAKAVQHPERVVGLHFFNPVHRMMLVEVIRHEGTSEDALATAAAFVQRIGKTPVIVRDSPGFVVNRVLMPYFMEAARLYEEGAGPREIDEPMLDFGMPMGPLRLLDEIGLDVAAHVARTLQAAFPDRLRPSALLDEMVAAGRLGKKSGEGFYRHTPRGEVPVGASSPAVVQASEIQERLTLALANEAARCVSEGVARSAADVDLAMVLGAGYPPFLGGPLAWIESCGRENVAADLRSLAARTPAPHSFDPAPMLSRDAVGAAQRDLASAPPQS
jgi:3-hydroxyacyl-CoA dehydrogenase/enoyl-CoA hydratase/3-hydroxybutyryl-CoA epimerase